MSRYIHIDDLPKLILVHILDHIPLIDLPQVSHVSKLWNELCCHVWDRKKSIHLFEPMYNGSKRTNGCIHHGEKYEPNSIDCLPFEADLFLCENLFYIFPNLTEISLSFGIKHEAFQFLSVLLSQPEAKKLTKLSICVFDYGEDYFGSRKTQFSCCLWSDLVLSQFCESRLPFLTDLCLKF
ncbi:hypothetical protein BLOT_006017 [Blomia tropicalis]|nr:hypothetical protein BLOT_006017 [Blomia tropicalis]